MSKNPKIVKTTYPKDIYLKTVNVEKIRREGHFEAVVLGGEVVVRPRKNKNED